MISALPVELLEAVEEETAPTGPKPNYHVHKVVRSTISWQRTVVSICSEPEQTREIPKMCEVCHVEEAVFFLHNIELGICQNCLPPANEN